MPKRRTSSGIELLVQLRRDDARPLHTQLEASLREAVRSSRLAAGSPLPSSRALADQLDLSRGVVVEAYEQLVAEGYLVSRPGGVTRVATGVAGTTAPRRAKLAGPEVRFDFSYGRPDVTYFPRATWLRSIRRVLNDAPSDRLSYLDERGAPELREALAAYLDRVRGTIADPERIVATTGFAQSLNLVSRILRRRGDTIIAVEEPGQRDAVRAARDHDLEPVMVPVDGEGIDVGALAGTPARAVVLTPAHHFPTGAVLSPARRSALVDWADQVDGLILEDDYDAEYRYDREPIGALQGLAPERVIYAGSASKTLAPGLRLGWLVAPERLVDDIAQTKQAADRGTASLEQLAFADFLSRGEFDHHLRRMRPIYRARRDVLLAALQTHLPEARPVGASAGLHVLAWLPHGVDEARLIELAAAKGVRLDGVAPYRFVRGDHPGGLLFGYGTLTEDQIDAGIRLVAAALASMTG